MDVKNDYATKQAIQLLTARGGNKKNGSFRRVFQPFLERRFDAACAS